MTCAVGNAWLQWALWTAIQTIHYQINSLPEEAYQSITTLLGLGWQLKGVITLNQRLAVLMDREGVIQLNPLGSGL